MLLGFRRAGHTARATCHRGAAARLTVAHAAPRSWSHQQQPPPAAQAAQLRHLALSGRTSRWVHLCSVRYLEVPLASLPSLFTRTPGPWHLRTPVGDRSPGRRFASRPTGTSRHCVRASEHTPPPHAQRHAAGAAEQCAAALDRTGLHWTLWTLDTAQLLSPTMQRMPRGRANGGACTTAPSFPIPGHQAPRLPPRLRLPAFPTHTHLAPPGPAASVSLSFPCLALLLSCRDLRPAAAAEHWQKQTGQALSAPGCISPSAALTTHTTHTPHTHHTPTTTLKPHALYYYYFAASTPPAHLLGQFTLSLKLPADAHTGWLSDPGPHVLLTSHPIPLISRIPPRPQVLYPPLLHIHIQHHTRRPPSSHPASLSPQSLFRCTPTTTSTFPPLDDPGKTALPCLASPLDVSIIISPTIEPCRQSTTVREPFH